MKLPWPLLSLLRRLTALSSLLRARGLVLPSDCVEDEELLRLRTVWLDIVCIVVVGDVGVVVDGLVWLVSRCMCLVVGFT